MSAVNRDVRFQTIIHAGRVIPPHGEGASPVITFDADMEVANGATTDVYQMNPNRGAQMVYSLRREEDAYQVLKEIVLEQRKVTPRPKAGGLGKDESNPDNIETVTWDDSACVQYPDFTFGKNSEVVTFTFRLSDVELE